jgi:hypothetical protein
MVNYQTGVTKFIGIIVDYVCYVSGEIMAHSRERFRRKLV